MRRPVGEGDDGDDGDDGGDGGDKAEVVLLNWEQRRKSGQEALNICRTGSQPSLAASQNDAQGNTTVLLCVPSAAMHSGRASEQPKSMMCL